MSKPGMSSYGMNFQLGESQGSYVDFGDVISGEPPTGGDMQFVPDKALGQPTRGIRSIPTFKELGEGPFMVKTTSVAIEQLLEWENTEPPPRLYAKLTFPLEVDENYVPETTPATFEYRVYLKKHSTPFDADGGRVQTTIDVKADGWDDDEDWHYTAGS